MDLAAQTELMSGGQIPAAEVHVVLLSYNRRSYFREAIDSVLAQTYRDFQLLVIDDASTDGTLEIAKEYERRLPGRVTVVSKAERRGVSHSMNLGVALTKASRYVAFHNDDDVWLPEKLQSQVATFRENPLLGFVATDAAMIDAEGRPTGKLFSDLYGKPDLDNPAWRIFWYGNCYCTPSVMASRAALDLVEPYQPCVVDACEDMYMWLVISSRMAVAWLKEPLTLCRSGAGHQQVTRSHGRKMWRETYALRDRLLDVDASVRAVVGGKEAGRWRLDDNALYLAHSFLRQLDFESYAWFAWQVLKRRRVRLAVLLVKYTAQGLLEAGRARLSSTPSGP